MRPFRVLILDDDARVMERLESRVSSRHEIAGFTWDVEIVGVHVEAEESPTGPVFSERTLNALAAAARKPFDLILADYGYPTPSQVASLSARTLAVSEYARSSMTLARLPAAVIEFVRRQSNEHPSVAVDVESNLNSAGKVFLYTYTRPEWRPDLPTVEERRKLTQVAFRKSSIIAIDTLEEFFAGGRFASLHDSEYYAYLVANLLENIIHRELLLSVVRSEQHRLRYVRYFRSGLSVTVIVLIGGAVGATSEWIGTRVMALVHAGETITALLVIGLAVLLFFAIGLCIPVVFERWVSNLLTKDTD